MRAKNTSSASGYIGEASSASTPPGCAGLAGASWITVSTG